jgi:hypothetical protein
MASTYVGTITVKDGVPQCPVCLKSMTYMGNEKHPSGTEVPVFRCPDCGNEFPPAEARAASRKAWHSERDRQRRGWLIVLGAIIVVGLAVAVAWFAGLFS